MNDWPSIWLGVMGISLAVMALVQVGVAIVLLRVGNKVATVGEGLREDVQPLLAKSQRVLEQAEQAAAMATREVQHVERLLTRTAERAELSLGRFERWISSPARQGAAVLTGLRAAYGYFTRHGARSHRTRHIA